MPQRAAGLDVLTAVALDASRPEAVRVAALGALSDLGERDDRAAARTAGRGGATACAAGAGLDGPVEADVELAAARLEAVVGAREDDPDLVRRLLMRGGRPRRAVGAPRARAVSAGSASARLRPRRARDGKRRAVRRTWCSASAAAGWRCSTCVRRWSRSPAARLAGLRRGGAGVGDASCLEPASPRRGRAPVPASCASCSPTRLRDRRSAKA